jgi:high affinity Mn2+ porin
LPSNHVVSKFVTARSDAEERWDYVGTVRGRVGFASGPWLAYATGGFAWAGERFLNIPVGVDVEEKHINVRPGWAAGAGLEYAFAPHWSVRLEYLYARFGKLTSATSGAELARRWTSSSTHRPQPQGRCGIKLDT